jgi:hypothetical protein
MGKLLFAEPVPILTIHSHRVAFMDVLGSDFHFALCLEQPLTGVPNAHEHIVNNRISMPISGVAEAMPLVFRRLPEVLAHRSLAAMMQVWRGQKLVS